MKNFFLTIILILLIIDLHAQNGPDLIRPENNLNYVQTDNLEFMWHSIPQEIFYRIQISRNITFDPGYIVHESDRLDTSVVISNLPNNLTLFWRVLSAKNSSWSEIRNFTTVDFPSTPILISPKDGANNLDTVVTMVWDKNPNNSEYRLEVARNSSFTELILAEALQDTSYVVDELDYNTFYYWRVRALNVDNMISGWSVANRFKTGLIAPIIVFPEAGQRNVPLELRIDWESVPGGTAYDFQFSVDNEFQNLLIDQRTSNTYYDIADLDYFKEYFWRVRVRNVAGELSPWNEANFFTTPGFIFDPIFLADSINQSDRPTDSLKMFYVSNEGEQQLGIDEIFVTPDSIFSVNKNSLFLAPGQKDSLLIKIDTTQVDSINVRGSLVLIRNSESENDTSEVKISVLLQRAIASFSVDSVLFDTTQSATKSISSFFIKNVEGNTRLKINKYLITGEDTSAFKVIRSPESINPGDSTLVQVEFSPIKLGQHNAQLDIETNSYPIKNYSFVIEGIGRGGEIASETIQQLETLSSISFESLNNNNKTFEVKNTGSKDLTFSLGFDEYFFNIITDEPNSYKLEPGQAKEFFVQFLTPTFHEEVEDSLIIWHNGFGKSPIKFSVKGKFDSLQSTSVLRNGIRINSSSFNNEALIVGEATTLQSFIDPSLLESYENLEVRFNYYLGGPGGVRRAVNTGDGRYLIPFDKVNGRGILLYADLISLSNNGTILDSINIFNEIDVQVVLDNYSTVSINVPKSSPAESGDLANTKWVFFGYPFNDVLTDSVFAEFGGREMMLDGEWIVYGFNSTADEFFQYQEYYFEPGKAYFAAQALTESFNLSYTYENSVLTRKLSENVMSLEGSGWKAITSPYTFDVEVDSSVILYKYETGTGSFRLTSVMRPGVGYFVPDGIQQITFTNHGIYYPDLFPKQLSNLSLLSDLTVKGIDEEEQLYIGFRDNNFEKRGSEIRKIPSVPKVFDGLSIYLFGDEKKYSAVIELLDEGHIFDLIVENNLEDDIIKFSENLIGDLPNGYSTLIYDLHTNQIVDENQHIEIINNKSYRFKYIVGPNEFIEKSIEEIKANVPEEFRLYHNYPNPFNPITTIKFSIPYNSNVSLKIYDLLGREVESLLSEYKNAGTYEITFNALNLASGIYFYRITTDKNSDTKKLILLK